MDRQYWTGEVSFQICWLSRGSIMPDAYFKKNFCKTYLRGFCEYATLDLEDLECSNNYAAATAQAFAVRKVRKH